MENHDWSKFNKRISIKTDHETILNAWLSQEQLEKWFLRIATFRSENHTPKAKSSAVEKGDSYIWKWHGSNDIAEGVILNTNNKDLLEFTFLGCTVSIKLSIEGGENIIELTQSNIPLDEASRISHYIGCSRGWTFYLTNLKSILEGGIDLRNRNENLFDVINT